MKLSEILNPDNIIPDLRAKDKKGVLEELVDVIVSHDPSLDKGS
ncbi:MAG: PTS sugar transporter subunit IIA, partial [Desulfobacterales bacterium]|nr:PTS sugar transporter subunit IIA [Desulfobacterales bacterium]